MHQNPLPCHPCFVQAPHIRDFACLVSLDRPFVSFVTLSSRSCALEVVHPGVFVSQCRVKWDLARGHPGRDQNRILGVNLDVSKLRRQVSATSRSGRCCVKLDSGGMARKVVKKCISLLLRKAAGHVDNFGHGVQGSRIVVDMANISGGRSS